MSLTSGIEIEEVAQLYEEFDRLEAIDLTAHGITNPLQGRCAIVPRRASHYAMVLQEDGSKLSFARMAMKGLAKRRKVREVVCEKHEINFNQFAPASKVVVLYA